MRAIFSSASQVYSWLGEGTPGPDVAIDFCARIGSKAAKVGIDQCDGADLHCFLQDLFDYHPHPFRFHLKREETRSIGARPELAAFFTGLTQEPYLKGPPYNGVHSPIVLRQRREGGFTFAGDAYVDGIMQGEFFHTLPNEQEFVIY